MWSAQAAKMGYRWHIGNGEMVRYWEDHWFGSCSLAIQFWEIYSIINEKGITVKEAWDGTHIRFTFRRTVTQRLWNQWLELVQISGSIQFTEANDSIIWQFNSSGRYSVQSLYAVVSDRRVRQVFTPVVWKLHVPSRLHIFLWLIANNKILTRDNLTKRRVVDDATCLFCGENETVSHLFFECCVAKVVWQHISEIVGMPLGADFESVARLWVSDKKHRIVNVCTTAALWSLWKLRNEICCQGAKWIGVQVLLRKSSRMLRDWKLTNRQEDAGVLERWADELEQEAFYHHSCAGGQVSIRWINLLGIQVILYRLRVRLARVPVAMAFLLRVSWKLY
jgi:hypothetical protein